ncbi:MAG TPA: hypothetical protein VFD58_00550 [Blastocatellia bacterium]|nr:hypothetical protein [Blastocatellia bacterium]
MDTSVERSLIMEVQETGNETPWLKQCRCGFNRHHYLVEPVCRYNFWGMVRLVMGVTAWPIAVSYQCLQCGEIIETTSDPDVLREQV